MFKKRKLELFLKKYLNNDNLETMNYYEEKEMMRTTNTTSAKTISRKKTFYIDDKSNNSMNITDFIKKNKVEDTFQTKLFKYIDKKGMKDSDVYNKVNIDRRLFSKIRNDINYHPSKETIILLGISLELNEKEIEELLESASYSLPMNTTYDLIIRFCFKEHIYNLNTINEFLYDHNCKTLIEN